jgi:hypothetical protein
MWNEQGDTLAAQFGVEPELLAYLDQVAKAAAASA